MKSGLLSLVVCFSLFANAQSSNFPLQRLATTWEVVENNFGGKRQFQAAFTFKNTSGRTFPAKGWNIFFNFPRMIDVKTVSPQVTIEHINGDFYKLSPAAGFKGIRAKDSLVVTYVAGAWAVSISDVPTGPYLVWDKAPEKGIPLTAYTVKPTTNPKQYLRYEGDKIPLTTPAIVYEQNASIQAVPDTSLIKVFPTPLTYTKGSGSFLLDNKVQIIADSNFTSEATYLQQELRTLVGGATLSQDSARGSFIRLLHKDLAAESYELTIDSTRITIAAGTGSGIFYGIQSLKTLLPAKAWKEKQKMVELSALNITDAPRFGFRSFMMDVARNFQTKQQVLKVLDLMALYKLNVFHFHFNDDEGWRIEIPGLPELTEVGGRRGHTTVDGSFLHPSFGSGPSLNSYGSGFYTRADFIEILRYAKARHIRVIPEIETPGHARAAVAAMNYRYKRFSRQGDMRAAEEYLLADPADISQYRSVQRWTNNVMNVGMPSTYRFLEKVTDELMAMYKEAEAPLERIHFGGDEVPSGVWLRSPAVRLLMQQEASVSSVNDLWYYFFGQVNNMLQKKGLALYGWEEVAMRKTKLDGKNIYIPNPDFVNSDMQVDVWNNVIGWGAEDLPYQLANAGYKVILSPVSNMYFDLAYEKTFDEPGQYWGGYLDIDKPYYFIPFDYYKNATQDINGNKVTKAFFDKKERLTDYGKQQIPGLQGALWGETLHSAAKMEYLLLPKLLSLAERAWSPDPAWTTEKDSVTAQAMYNKAWSQFVTILGKQELPRLDYYAGGFQYRIPTVGAIRENGSIRMNTQLPGYTIRYTTDGREPKITSPVYTQPIPDKGVVKARLFSPSGRGGRTVIVNETEQNNNKKTF